ncbi:MAG: hypothetical protein JNL10_07375 [Verrucomicrobiales bacterium]|nr:hypothetical protein [Verrucomicrobiales bacterium]
MKTPVKSLMKPVRFQARKAKGARRGASKAAVEWHSVSTPVGPSRYGFDFEMMDLVTIREPGTIIDLPLRASYGLFLITGGCRVAWQDLEAEATREARIGRENWKAFEKRVGVIQMDFSISKAGDWVNLETLPRAVPAGSRELLIGSTYQVTLVSTEPQTVLMVFSSNGPGTDDRLRPPVIS